MIKKVVNNGSLWAVLLVIIRTLISLFLIRYVTNVIGIEAYGYVSLANTFITYIDILAISFNYFFQRHVSVFIHSEDLESANKYYYSIIVTNLVLWFILGIPASICIANIEKMLNVSTSLLSDVKLLFMFILIKYFFSLFENVFQIGAFVSDRIDLSAKNKIISNIIQMVLLVALFSLGAPRLYYVGVAAVFAEFIGTALQFAVKSRLLLKVKMKFGCFSLESVLELLKNGIWVSINNLGNILNHGLDLLITNLMISEIVVGYIAVAKMIESLCYSIVIAISDSFKPVQTAYYSQNDNDKMVHEFLKAMSFSGAAFILMFGMFIGVGKEILDIWLTDQNTVQIYILAVICIAADWIPSVVKPLYYIYTLSKRMKVPCYITLAMGALNVTSMYLLLKNTNLGSYAVVLTTAVINLIHLVDAPIYSSHCIRVKTRTFYPTIMKYIFTTIVVMVASIGIKLVLSPLTGIIWLIIKSLILFAVILGILFSVYRKLFVSCLGKNER